MMELKDKRVMVMGLARSGLSAANLLAERGAMVTVSDIKTEEQLPEQLSALAPGIKYELGGHRLESFWWGQDQLEIGQCDDQPVHFEYPVIQHTRPG